VCSIQKLSNLLPLAYTKSDLHCAYTHLIENKQQLARSLLGVRVPLSLATAYWATSAHGGVTRQGVVLTYLLSLGIGGQ